MPRKKGQNAHDASQLVTVRLPKSLVSSINLLTEEHSLSRNQVLQDLFEFALFNIDDQKYSSLLAKYQEVKVRQTMLERSNRNKFVAYFLKNALTCILDIARVEYICNHSLPMSNIKQIIIDYESLFETFSEEEQKRTRASLGILKSYKDESRLKEIVSNMTAIRLIKNA